MMPEITALIKGQAVDCMVMFSCGTFLALLYCIAGSVKRKMALKKIWAGIFELLFWAGAAVVIGEFLYYCAYGRWSFHSLLALVLGSILSKKFFYKAKYGIIKPNWLNKNTSHQEMKSREDYGKKAKKSRIQKKYRHNRY